MDFMMACKSCDCLFCFCLGWTVSWSIAAIFQCNRTKRILVEFTSCLSNCSHKNSFFVCVQCSSWVFLILFRCPSIPFAQSCPCAVAPTTSLISSCYFEVVSFPCERRVRIHLYIFMASPPRSAPCIFHSIRQLLFFELPDQTALDGNHIKRLREIQFWEVLHSRRPA